MRTRTRRGRRPKINWPKISPLVAIPAAVIVMAFAACDSNRNESTDSRPPTLRAEPEHEVTSPISEPPREASVAPPPRETIEEEPASTEGPPDPKLTPYQARTELKRASNEMLEQVKELDTTKAYHMLITHIETARFSDDTPMYPGTEWLDRSITSGMYRSYKRRRVIPKQVVRALPRMPITHELMKIAPHTAVAIIATVYCPSKRLQEKYDMEKGLKRPDGEQLARLFTKFYKAAKAIDPEVKLRSLDAHVAAKIWDFNNTKETWEFEHILNPENAETWLLTSAAWGRFKSFGMQAPSDPRDSGQREVVRLELQRTMNVQ